MEITRSILSGRKFYKPPSQTKFETDNSKDKKISTMSGFSFVSRRAYNRAAMSKPVLSSKDKHAKQVYSRMDLKSAQQNTTQQNKWTSEYSIVQGKLSLPKVAQQQEQEKSQRHGKDEVDSRENAIQRRGWSRSSENTIHTSPPKVSVYH